MPSLRLRILVLFAFILTSACGRSSRTRPALYPTPVPHPSTPPAAKAPAAPPPPEPSTILGVGGDVHEPIEITRVQPAFPDLCQHSVFQGGVAIFELVIDARGNVTSVRTLRLLKARPPCPELEAACKKALSQWRYEPATLRGVPVPVHLTVTLSFHWR